MKLLGTNPTCTGSEPGTASMFIRGPKNKKPKNKNKILRLTFFFAIIDAINFSFSFLEF